MIPIIFCGALTLGSWLLTGKWFEFSLKSMTRQEWFAAAKAHAWEWVVGSFVLAIIVSVTGSILTYIIARWVRKNER
jgi:hypothetical protein